jgi:hypothetical protein
LLLQSLQEGRVAGRSLRIIFGQIRDRADAAHPIALLRARRERPGRDAAKQGGELAPPHVDHAIVLCPCYRRSLARNSPQIFGVDDAYEGSAS